MLRLNIVGGKYEMEEMHLKITRPYYIAPHLVLPSQSSC